MKIYFYTLIFALMMVVVSCKDKQNETQQVKDKTAENILGNPAYQAISYGGYRQITRDIQPTIAELKEDLKIMHAMGIRIIRTYNVKLAEASNLCQAIKEMKADDSSFEMYIMLGAWIDCKNAWTELPVDHNVESEENQSEISRAVDLTNKYPDIVKIIAVGNEAMVKWAESYYVQPDVILKWVSHLQNLKKEAKLPKDLWITSSDNFASWGGGDTSYHVENLTKLYHAVDYISIHTYPMHDTHYNPDFWGVKVSEASLSDKQKIDSAMMRSRDYAVHQYNSVVKYMKSLGVNKPVHIGETGWSTFSNYNYGDDGSKACDEYKSALYYKLITEWCAQNKVTCFYFEAFDEQWKDAKNPKGSENHFGLINLKSQAKYALWEQVDQGVFKGLTRDGKPITKTFEGNMDYLWKYIKLPPTSENLKHYK